MYIDRSLRTDRSNVLIVSSVFLIFYLLLFIFSDGLIKSSNILTENSDVLRRGQMF